MSFIRKDLLKFVILSQLVPRLVRIYPINKEVTATAGMLIEMAWASAAINLFFYMLANHVSLNLFALNFMLLYIVVYFVQRVEVITSDDAFFNRHWAGACWGR